MCGGKKGREFLKSPRIEESDRKAKAIENLFASTGSNQTIPSLQIYYRKGRLVTSSFASCFTEQIKVTHN